MSNGMLITILFISIYLAGIVFHIQSNSPTDRVATSLLWPIQFIKVGIWSVSFSLSIILPIYKKTKIYKFINEKL